MSLPVMSLVVITEPLRMRESPEIKQISKVHVASWWWWDLEFFIHTQRTWEPTAWFPLNWLRKITGRPWRLRKNLCTHHFRGIYGIYVEGMIKKSKRSQHVSWLDLETLGPWPIMPKNLPGQCTSSVDRFTLGFGSKFSPSWAFFFDSSFRVAFCTRRSLATVNGLTLPIERHKIKAFKPVTWQKVCPKCPSLDSLDKWDFRTHVNILCVPPRDCFFCPPPSYLLVLVMVEF